MSPFWTAFWILFIWVPLVTMWVFALTDIFRREDIHGIAKALWFLAIVFLPVVGLLIYFVARPADAPTSAGAYAVASGQTVGEELALLAELHDRGKLTDQEFADEKARVLTGI